MKKIIAIVLLLLLSSTNIVNGATWLETLQEAFTGKPTTEQAASVGTEPAALSTATAATDQLDQIKNTIPSFIENIKVVVAKFNDVTKAAQGGFFSGLKAAFSIDKATATAFSQLTTQAGTVVTAAASLLKTSDPQIKATVQGYLNEIVKIPEFQQLVEYAKNMPFIGKQLSGYLNSLKEDAEAK